MNLVGEIDVNGNLSILRINTLAEPNRGLVSATAGSSVQFATPQYNGSDIMLPKNTSTEE